MSCGPAFLAGYAARSAAEDVHRPRLLRIFIPATINQAVGGTFVATFRYCLLVPRSIRRADEVVIHIEPVINPP